MDLASPAQGASKWIPRTHAGAPGERAMMVEGTVRQGLPAFAGERGRIWAMCLAPTMWLLARLGDNKDAEAPSSSSYTLY